MHINFLHASRLGPFLSPQEIFCITIFEVPRLAAHVRSMVVCVDDDDAGNYESIRNALSVVKNLKHLRIAADWMYLNDIESLPLIPDPPFSLTTFKLTVSDQNQEGLNDYTIVELHQFLESQTSLTYLNLPNYESPTNIPAQLCPSLKILEGHSHLMLDWLRNHSSVVVVDVAVMQTWQDTNAAQFYSEFAPLLANINRIRILDISPTLEGHIATLVPYLTSLAHAHLVISKKVRLLSTIMKIQHDFWRLETNSSVIRSEISVP